MKPALSDALSVILPTPQQTLVLRACLSPGDWGRRAWREAREMWAEQISGPKNGLRAGGQGLRSLQPLLLNALRRNGVTVDKSLLTLLRTAYLREELRTKIFRRICRDILLLLESEGIPTIVLKGMALADTVYGNPVLRHCHDIDVLIRSKDMSQAASLLPSLRFKTIRPQPPGTHHWKFEHESGLPLELHTQLFQMSHYNGPSAEFWARSQSQLIADVPAHILAPSDNLLHICGHASYSRAAQSLRWVTDAWFLIDRHPDLDWDLLLDCARRSHLALPLSVTLGYLAKDLNTPIPSTFLSYLFAAASQTDTIGREAALCGALASGRAGVKNLLRGAGDWRTRAFVIKCMLFPSPHYLRWIEQVRHAWLLPFYYIYRPLRYIARRLGLR